MSRILSVLALASALAVGASGCGLDCEEYCDKMDDCDDRDCDTSQCVDFCEQALENDEVGFEGSAMCAIDESCDNLDDGACFPFGREGRGWCDF